MRIRRGRAGDSTYALGTPSPPADPAEPAFPHV